ncbi:MAG TPA: hypothetical protein VFM58_13955 [Solirubrobacteraceae bacterium]|nr:hypothetical protein [Solirubrobacteraceae bacterium]
MSAFDEDIAAYHDRGEEQRRLWEWGRLERVRTQELLQRLLPKAPAVVYDVGGGPGAYSVWLAERGHLVHLVDPVELHVTQARAAGVASARVGDTGFELTALLAIEGVGEWLSDIDDWLDDPPRRAALLRAIERVEAEPSLLGASPHILAVGAKS